MLRVAPAPGGPAPGLRTARALEVVDGDGEFAGAVVACLAAAGIASCRRREVSSEADAVIFLGGAGEPRDVDAAIAIDRAGFAAARGLARATGGCGGLYVAVVDLDGALGLMGAPAARPWAGGLCGLVKTAAQEWSAGCARVIDVGGLAHDPRERARRVVEELVTGDRDSEVALTADGRRVVVHEPAPRAPASDTSWLAPGMPLVVTGGARGITSFMVRELARHRPRLALLGATALVDEPAATRGAHDDAALKRALLAGDATLDPRELGARAHAILASREIRATVAACAKAGAEVRYLTVDVRRGAAVAAALDGLRAAWGPIAGIIHGAGVLVDRRIDRTEDADFDAVFDPKVAGLRHLLAATAGDPLVLLLLFSSIAGRLGNDGQAAYAMANEVLAKVAAAEARRREGCLVRAIDWGPWNGGMVRPALARLFISHGVSLIDPALGGELLAAELDVRGGEAEVIVVAGALPAALSGMKPTASPSAADASAVTVTAMAAAPSVTPALLAPSGHASAGVPPDLHEAHRAFIQVQRTLHQEFLEQQERTLALVRSRSAGVATRSPASVAPSPAPVELLDEAALRRFCSAPGTAEWWSGAIGPAATRARWSANGATVVTSVDRGLWHDDDALALGVLLDPTLALHLSLAGRGIAASRVRLDEFVVDHAGSRPRKGATVEMSVEVVAVAASQDTCTVVDFHHRTLVDGRGWSSGRGRAVVDTCADRGEAGPLAASVRSAPTGIDWTQVASATELSADQLRAIAAGDLSPLGPSLRATATHSHTPRLPPPPLLLIERVLQLDLGSATAAPRLRFTVSLSADRWYVAGGELAQAWAIEAARQGACLLLVALGVTVGRDAWRFEPVAGQRIHARSGRTGHGAVGELVFELSAAQVGGDGTPTLVADVDAYHGPTAVFRARGVGVALVRDWPLSRRALPQPTAEASLTIAEIWGVRFDLATMLAGAWGCPGDAFGPAGRPFEAPGRSMPRLPGPPYHFVSRVVAVVGTPNTMTAGPAVTTEYDIAPDAWYFQDGAAGIMPWCVLLEVALQPCGWLSVYVGCPVATAENVFFRNLDGEARITGHVTRTSGTIRVTATLTRLSHVSGIMLVAFDVTCSVGETVIARLRPGFGYFPRHALAAQVGLPPTDDERAQLTAASPVTIDLARLPSRYFDGALRMPAGMLRMIDRITGYWATGGRAGAGRVRAEKAIDAGAWYFKAHFFDDPVQPGSLGLEMVLQTLQFVVLHDGLAADLPTPRFEPIALEEDLAWKLRGQCTYDTRQITVEVDLLERRRDPAGAVVLIAAAWLWADATRVYEIKRIGLRVSSATTPVPPAPERIHDERLDPDVDRWICDHRPNLTNPVMPLMSIVDRLAAAALRYAREAYPNGDPPWQVVGVDDAQVKTWLICARPTTVRTEVFPQVTHAFVAVEAITLRIELSADRDTGGQFVFIAAGLVRLARHHPPPPPAWPRLADAVPGPDVYASGALFHGPAFHMVRSVAYGAQGSTSVIDAGAGTVPVGALHQALLDAALHGIPHDDLSRWSPEIRQNQTAFPSRVQLELHGPPPRAGLVRCEVRLVGFKGAKILPLFEIQMIGDDGRVWMAARLVEVLVPMGAGGHGRIDRLSYLRQVRDRVFTPGVGLSDFVDGRTSLEFDVVRRMDWLPGSVAYAYNLPAGDDLSVLARKVAVKEHVAQRLAVHAALLEVASDGTWAQAAGRPDTRLQVRLVEDADRVVVSDATNEVM